MKFALPLGLLGLTAIAALILIYILKPKYQEKKISSTYVWKLSLRYRKHKVPFQWLKNSLLFMVQVILIAAIAFTMAQPRIVLGTKNGEKIVILEASASMLAESGGKTRFDRAKSEIGALADVTVESDRFSVIWASADAEFLVRRSDSASYVKQKLAEADCTFAQADMEKAMALAEDVLTENPNAEVILYTSRDYKDAGNVTVKNMSRAEWNAAIVDFTAKREKGYYVFAAEIASYGRAAEMAVSLKIDGKSQPPKLADCGKNETVRVEWSNLEIGEYKSAEIRLSAEDSFPYDNDFALYSQSAERFKVQLVSESPGFLYASLRALENCVVDIPEDEESAASSGYDLYIYDVLTPDKLPNDGAVWLISPSDTLPADSGIGISSTREGEFTLSGSGGSSDAYQNIMKGVTPSSISVTKYQEVTRYAGYESLMKCGNDPVLLAKNDNGAKTVLMAFDIHNSILPVLPDFSILIYNLFHYSVTRAVQKTLYNAGEEIVVNARANAESVSVTADYIAGGKDSKEYTLFPIVLQAAIPGFYTISQKLDTDRTTSQNFFVRVPKHESEFFKTEETLINPSIVSEVGTDTSIGYDTMDITMYLAILLLALICLEWGLQYREQY